jgi:hypothetical protein
MRYGQCDKIAQLQTCFSADDSSFRIERANATKLCAEYCCIYWQAYISIAAAIPTSQQSRMCAGKWIVVSRVEHDCFYRTRRCTTCPALEVLVHRVI